MLAALERADQESLSRLQARQAIELQREQVQLQALRVKAATEGIQLAELQRGSARLRRGYYAGLLEQGWLADESTALVQLWSASKLHAGAAALHLTQATLSVMPSSILGGLASSLTSAAAALSANASVLQILAGYERRAQEWAFQQRLALQDERVAMQQVEIARTQAEAAATERRIAQSQLEHALATGEFLLQKFTSAELYGWIARVLEDVYAFFLKQATAIALAAERQLEFERQQIGERLIGSDYWRPGAARAGADAPSETRGLTGAARLARDLERLDAYALESAPALQKIQRTFSLLRLDPIAFARFRESGVYTLRVPFEVFDLDFPGHYLRTIKRVRLALVALTPTAEGIRATLRAHSSSVVVKQSHVFADLPNRRPPETVALSVTPSTPGVFDFEPDTTRLRPFEGMGVNAVFELEMPRASNAFDYDGISDVLLTLDYTAVHDPDLERRVLDARPRRVSQQQVFGLRTQFAEAWYHLANLTNAGDGPVIVEIALTRRLLPSNLQAFDATQATIAVLGSGGGAVTLSGVSVQKGPLASGQKATTEGLARFTASWGDPFGVWTLAFAPEIRGLIADGDVSEILFVVGYDASRR